jgi:hypothetical protein
MDQEQTRMGLNASLVVQYTNLLYVTEIPAINFLQVRLFNGSCDLMFIVKNGCSYKVWDSVRDSLFHAIYNRTNDYIRLRL